MIAIYSGRGVDEKSLSTLIKSVQKVTECEIILVDHHNLFNRSPALFIMPGGRDCPYHEDLGLKGAEQICQHVEQGGSYLGICAGAYFASAVIEFEKGGGATSVW